MSALAKWATERTDRDTFGPKVAEVASALGIDLLPWQRQVVDTALEHVDGRLVYRDVGVAVPRQAGKSDADCSPSSFGGSWLPAVWPYTGRKAALPPVKKLIDDWWPVISLTRPCRGTSTCLGRRAGGAAAPFRLDLSVSFHPTRPAHGQTLNLAVDGRGVGGRAAVEQAVGRRFDEAKRPDLANIHGGHGPAVWWRGKVESGVRPWRRAARAAWRISSGALDLAPT